MNQTIPLFFVLSCFFVQNSFAQPDKIVEEMSLEELMNVEVTTASRVRERLLEAPATVYVITAKDIQERGYTYLIELLEDIPEFEYQDKSVAENYGVLSVRGIAGQDRMQILMDGARINSMAATFHATDRNFNIRHAERVEIVMGPASALYGADAFSCVVNIITKKGSDMRGGTVMGSYGLYNSTDNALTVGLGNSDFSLTASGSFFRSAEPFMPKFYSTEYAWYTQQYAPNGNVLSNIFPGADTIAADTILPWGTPKQAFTFHTKMNFQDVEVGCNYSAYRYSTSNGVAPQYTVYGADNFYDVRILTLYGKHTWVSIKKRWSVENMLVTTQFNVVPQSRFYNSFSGYKPAYKFAMNRGSQWTSTATYQINEVNRLTGGINYRVISAIPKTSDLPVPYDPGISPTGDLRYFYIGSNVVDANGRDLTLAQDFYAFNEHTVGGFVQYQGNVQDKLFLTVGTRVDYNTRYGIAFNPRLGLVMKPIDKLRIRLSYGEAVLSPSPEFTYQHYGTFFFNEPNNQLESFFFHLPNANLQEIKLRSGEIGFNYLSKDFAINLGGFYNGITDEVTLAYNNDVRFKDALIYVAETYQNLGTSNSYGGTLKLDYRKSLSEGKQELAAYLAFTYMNGRYNTIDLVYQSEMSTKFGIFYRWKNLSVSVRGFWNSGPQTLATQNDEPTDLPPGLDYHFEENVSEYHISIKDYVLVNLFLNYRIISPDEGSSPSKLAVDAFVKVRNLTNARYYNAGFGSSDVMLAVPQDPVRIMGGFTVTFGRPRS